MSFVTVPDVATGRFVPGMAEDEYHAHPALSSTGMKNLLRSPKYYRVARAMNKPKPEFDVGHAVHSRVLGVGAEMVEIPAGLLSADGGIRSNAAKQFVEDARAAGQVPLKGPTYMAVVRAAESVLANPKARELLERDGFTEVSLFCDDPESGVALRSRLDRLAGLTPIDLKSTTDVSWRKVERAVVDYGYDVQAFTYRFVVSTVLGVPIDEVEPMHFIFIEKDPPHEARVVRLADPVWHEGGERKMRAAIDLFAWCTEAGSWPGDDDDNGPIRDLPAPSWYRVANTEEVSW